MAETEAPRVQRRSVVAKPIPELAPVTAITFPAKGVGERGAGKSTSRVIVNSRTKTLSGCMLVSESEISNERFRYRHTVPSWKIHDIYVAIGTQSHILRHPTEPDHPLPSSDDSPHLSGSMALHQYMRRG